MTALNSEHDNIVKKEEAWFQPYHYKTVTIKKKKKKTSMLFYYSAESNLKIGQRRNPLMLLHETREREWKGVWERKGEMTKEKTNKQTSYFKTTHKKQRKIQIHKILYCKQL